MLLFPGNKKPHRKILTPKTEQEIKHFVGEEVKGKREFAIFVSFASYRDREDLQSYSL